MEVFLGEMDGLAKLLQLPLSEIAPGSFGDAPKLQWPDASTRQLDGRITDPIEHLAHDPVLSFVDADPKPGAALLIAQWTYLLRTDPFAFNRDALAKCLEHCR